MQVLILLSFIFFTISIFIVLKECNKTPIKIMVICLSIVMLVGIWQGYLYVNEKVKIKECEEIIETGVFVQKCKIFINKEQGNIVYVYIKPQEGSITDKTRDTIRKIVFDEKIKNILDVQTIVWY